MTIRKSVLLLSELLQRPVLGELRDAQTCLAWIQDINHAYGALERWRMQAEDVVDLKLRVIYWRSKLLRSLLHDKKGWVANNKGSLHEILSALNIYLPPFDKQQVGQLTGERELAELTAQQGEEVQGHPDLDALSGPGINLNIVANRSSHWTFAKWRQEKRFSRYRFEQGGVRYRGMLFLPGDVLLANVNLDGNGIYTSLSDPKSFSSHSAFFAALEHDGQRFPVVVETYEKGVRPVPLNVFLGPQFSSYVEIYRHNDFTPAHANKINQTAMEFMRNVRGYNFDSEDQDTTYMSCTAVGRFLHQQSGLKPAQTKSRIGHPNIQANLRKLDYTFFDFFAPVDFLLNDCFHYAGYVDNNQIDRLLARELIDRTFRQQFMERTLEPKQFPFPYSLNRWGIGQIRKQSVIGKLIGLAEGFDDQNLPKGPDSLMAVIKLVEKQIGKAIDNIRPDVKNALAACTYLDMKLLTSEDGIRRSIQQNLSFKWLPPS